MSRGGLAKYRRGVDTAVGGALVAAMIALAQTARADTDLDPFEDLFGTAGINTWTAAADSSLASSDPTLAASLDTSVDNFLAAVPVSAAFPGGDDLFSNLVWNLDPSAFTEDYFYPLLVDGGGGLPLNATADFAVGLDYALFASGLAPVVDPLITGVEEGDSYIQSAIQVLATVSIFGFLDLLHSL